LASRLGHKKAEKGLNEKLNPYYTQTINPEDNIEMNRTAQAAQLTGIILPIAVYRGIKMPCHT
jgi:hypothetical protein